ncbi:MAG: hypothetical protein M1318_00480, partial [Firmicutes bacterium]|nr:hypothetical protein [Bacillota bacterium]
MKHRSTSISVSIILMALLTACGSGTKASGTAAGPFVTIGNVLAPGSTMNIFSSNTLVEPGMDIMPLAVSHNSANLGAFYPALASHWQVSNKGRTVTVWLRSNA